MAKEIKIFFLGTSDSVPSAKRNHLAILLTCEGENILVDCGEGTQRQFRKAKLNPCKVTKILITHFHADHILGIPGLLKTMELSGCNKVLKIYLPKKTKNIFDKLLSLFALKEDFGKIRIETIEVNGKFFETDEYYLEAKEMKHGTPTNAYSFVRKGLIKIKKKKLGKYKIPAGAHLKNLKKGKNINYRGKKYLAKNLTYREDDKKVTFILDTLINENAISISKNSDILICESTFLSKDKEKARERKHLTAQDAAEIAKKSKSKNLYLVHISQRYEKDMKKILEEAKKIFKNSNVPRDLDSVTLS